MLRAYVMTSPRDPKPARLFFDQLRKMRDSGKYPSILDYTIFHLVMKAYGQVKDTTHLMEIYDMVVDIELLLLFLHFY